jgi:hypothetical protein
MLLLLFTVIQFKPRSQIVQRDSFEGGLELIILMLNFSILLHWFTFPMVG